MKKAALILALLLPVGCASSPESGEWGVVRYFAELPGRTPMRLTPPITDRAGNIYVLHGDETRPEAQAVVGRVGGGWVESCSLHKGDDRGLHSWVGSGEDRAWYWSGDALVEVSGSGGCRALLDRDPVSSSDLRFDGVFPVVDNSPSRTLLTAYASTSTDRAPYFVTLDVDLARFETNREFEPRDAEDVHVGGIGSNASGSELYSLVSYTQGEQRIVEGRIQDASGNILMSRTIDGLDEMDVDEVRGYIQGDGQQVAAVVGEDRVVVFADGQSSVHRPFDSHAISPIGVHAWQGQLWLVGRRDGRPALAELTVDGLGPAIVWTASEQAAASLGAEIPVRDERDQPSVFIEWAGARSAIGASPFLSPYPPSRHAPDTAGWLVAGPSFNTGNEGTTAVAFAPVGISYP